MRRNDPSFFKVFNAPLFIFGIIFGIAIQSSLFRPWLLSHFQPDIALLAIVWCAFKRSFEEGGILTLLISNICEIHSSAPQGIFLISGISLFFTLRMLSKIVVIYSLHSYAILCAASTFLKKGVEILMVFLLAGVSYPWNEAARNLMIGSMVEALLAFVIFPLFYRLDYVTFKHSKLNTPSDEDFYIESEGF